MALRVLQEQRLRDIWRQQFRKLLPAPLKAIPLLRHRCSVQPKQLLTDILARRRVCAIRSVSS
eukprot:13555463-Alexandrium_andersonii.AAC.2